MSVFICKLIPNYTVRVVEVNIVQLQNVKTNNIEPCKGGFSFLSRKGKENTKSSKTIQKLTDKESYKTEGHSGDQMAHSIF